VVGHVWKGRVGNVLAGMEAAFIDVGLPKNGFLHVDEVVAMGVPRHKRKIADLLKKGDEVLVQATKDAMGTKGVRLTMQLSLAGRFIVYMPYGDGAGVSKRLPDAERERLRKVCKTLDLGKGGLIARTAAAGVSETDLARDLEALKRLWAALEERAGLAKPATLLYNEADISLKVMRDLLNQDVDAVIVDDEAQHERIVAFLRRTSPGLASRVRLHEAPTPLMEQYGVEAAIHSLIDRRVSLPSGGYLIIDDTEAMTVIDVNSGRDVGRGKTRLEDTITRTNLEAAEEVARQLRLRDIGGIVVIDFIDMDDAKNRRALEQSFRAALERDRTRTFVTEISPLGLVQMTRQNRSDGPREVMTETCPTCDGAGFRVTDETNAIAVERRLMEKLQGRAPERVDIAVHPAVADVLTADDGAWQAALEQEIGAKLAVERDPRLAEDGLRVGKV
jgi:ribonuclease G